MDELNVIEIEVGKKYILLFSYPDDVSDKELEHINFVVLPRIRERLEIWYKSSNSFFTLMSPIKMKVEFRKVESEDE